MRFSLFQLVLQLVAVLLSSFEIRLVLVTLGLKLRHLLPHLPLLLLQGMNFSRLGIHKVPMPGGRLSLLLHQRHPALFQVTDLALQYSALLCFGLSLAVHLLMLPRLAPGPSEAGLDLLKLLLNCDGTPLGWIHLHPLQLSGQRNLFSLETLNLTLFVSLLRKKN